MKRFFLGLAAGLTLTLSVVAATRTARAGTGDLPSALPVKPVDSDQALAVRVTPEMVRYSHTRYALYFIGTAVSAAALILLLRSGVSARLRKLAEERVKNPVLRAYIYYPLYTLAYGLLTLPLTFYSAYLLPHQYGLSNQKLGDWLLDGVKGFGLSAVLGPPVVALLYWTLRRSPGRWWVGFWLASMPLMIVTMVLGPLLIDPLFNKFEPLKNERLRDRILALAGEAGIERSRVFEVDMSKRTEGVNAYVTGIGGSARIVLWDTLLQKCDEDEVAFVMAHEMGHYAERHVPLLLLAGSIGTLFLLLITDRGARALIQRQGDRWGVRGIDDMASLPVLMLILMALNFAGSPVESGISRYFERRADAFGLRLTGDGRAAASAFIKLSEKNLSLPNPPEWIEFWMFSHPPLQERIDSALAFEQKAEPRR